MTERKQNYQNKINSKRAILQQKPSRSTGRILEDNRGIPESPVAQRKPNNTGLPDNLKSGMESVSGVSLDHVKVHYNSDKPAAVQAHAYAQGSDIHLASGQERHLPHELGHVVQQMQGKVQPTTTVGGMAVNDNQGLEREADVMGAQALQMKTESQQVAHEQTSIQEATPLMPIQRRTEIKHTTKEVSYTAVSGANKGKVEKDVVGIEMEAWLDPRNRVLGSQTEDPQQGLYDAVKSMTSTKMVRGHLLNHDLGGYGVSENLYPITDSANGLHKTNAENPIGKHLKTAKDNTGAGQGVYYKVELTHKNYTTAKEIAENSNSFKCIANDTVGVNTDKTGTKTGAAFVNCTVTSKPQGKGKKGTVKAAEDSAKSTTEKEIAQGWDHGNRKGEENFRTIANFKNALPNAQITTLQKFDNEELNNLLSDTIHNIKKAQELNAKSDETKLQHINGHYESIFDQLIKRLVIIHNECQTYDGVEVNGRDLIINKEQLKGDQLTELYETTVDLIHLAKDWLHVKTAVLHGLKFSTKNTANSSLNIFENPYSALHFIDADKEQHDSSDFVQEEQFSEKYEVHDLNQGQQTFFHPNDNINNNNINNAGNQFSYLSQDTLSNKALFDINSYQYSNQMINGVGTEEPHQNQGMRGDIEEHEEYDLNSLEQQQVDYQNVQEGEGTQADSHYRWGPEYSLTHSTTKNKEARPFKTKKIRRAGNTEQKSKNAPSKKTLKKDYTKLSQLNNEQLSKIYQNSNNASERVAAVNILRKRAMLDKMYAKRRQQSNSVYTANL